MNYFQGNKDHPQHVSVGAILMNDKGEVCCHHFKASDFKSYLAESGYWKDEGLDDFYILMRETLNPDETLEHALHRGLMEEFGAKAKMLDYIGSIRSHFRHKGVEVEKTTLYFLCELISVDESKRSRDDEEKTGQREWHAPGFLIPIMKEQAKKYGRDDVDESAILERAKGPLRR